MNIQEFPFIHPLVEKMLKFPAATIQQEAVLGRRRTSTA